MLGNVLGWCLNTTASDAVENLASQAQKISAIGEQLASKTTMSAMATTTSGAGSQAPNGVSTSTPTGESLTSTNSSDVTATGDNTLQATDQSTTSATTPLNNSWIAGPVIGSILGIGTVFIVIYCTRRIQNRKMMIETQPKIFKIDDDAASQSTQRKAQLHADSVSVKELDNTEIRPPVELPVPEPVGSELITPKLDSIEATDDWPLPLSPLAALFAMTEMRDEKAGLDDSPRHDTFYHP
ncbi:hypothetical protein B7494_g5575 [Chlorociboria aeruginascens]|nr:hypothetical protein B7494_g5575 [Chlorociboria aeruginascens]